MNRILFHLMAGLMLAGGTAYGATYYVSPSGNGSDGTSWETAFTTIPPALSAATAGDSIWTASGTYYGHIQLATGVSLFGGFIGTESTDEFHLRDPEVNKCIISINRPTNHPLFRGVNESELNGFHFNGGAVSGGYCSEVTMSILNCTFTNNRNNGAILPAAGGLGIVDSTVTLTNCRIVENRSGGVSIRDSSVTFQNCVVSHTDGAGVTALRSRVWMENCLISNNKGEIAGGIFVHLMTRLHLRHCTFDQNDSNNWDPVYMEATGQAIHQGDPGGLAPNTYVELENCILWDNWGPKRSLAAQFVFVKSNVLRLFDHPHPSITHVDSISVDPQFVDPENGNFRLKANSPCIDSGTETGLLIDLDGNPRPVDVPGVPNNPTAFDMGCYEYQLPVGDLNGDGKVDAKDLLIFQGQWMRED